MLTWARHRRNVKPLGDGSAGTAEGDLLYVNGRA